MRHAAPKPARTQPGRRRAGNRSRSDDAAPATALAAREQQQSPPGSQLAYWLVVAGTVLALASVRLGPHHLKSGTLVLAGVLLAAAVARLVLPDRRAGMLSSRRRWLDVAIFAVFGIGLLVAGLTVRVPA